MQFLADVQLVCAVCGGKRFMAEVLAVKHCGKSVADVLAMTVDEAVAFLDPPGARDYVIARMLQPAVSVGLGYLPLGQPLSTLSGGEAQRLKLARALTEKAAGTLFVLDEPSAGLHALDAAKVTDALHRLADDGASVLPVVEHDLDHRARVRLGSSTSAPTPAPPAATSWPKAPRASWRRPTRGRGALFGGSSRRAAPRGGSRGERPSSLMKTLPEALQNTRPPPEYKQQQRTHTHSSRTKQSPCCMRASTT